MKKRKKELGNGLFKAFAQHVQKHLPGWGNCTILVTAVSIGTPEGVTWPGLGVACTLFLLICSITDEGRGISVISYRPKDKESTRDKNTATLE